MSTGGNVPAQGVQLPAAPKRGARGNVGEGTRSTRLKAYWRKQAKDLPLRAFIKNLAGHKGEGAIQELVGDAKAWLMAKSGGTPEEKSTRKQRRKERASENRSAKLARKGKGKQQQKKAA